MPPDRVTETSPTPGVASRTVSTSAALEFQASAAPLLPPMLHWNAGPLTLATGVDATR